MNLEERIEGFSLLGKYIGKYIEAQSVASPVNMMEGRTALSILEHAVSGAEIENPWFTRDNIFTALRNILISMDMPGIEIFAKPYRERLIRSETQKTVGAVMAGNIPMAGFHDFFCTLLAGHRFLGKLSSEDTWLLPAVAEILFFVNPGFKNLISFTKEKLSGFNAVIATGSNNSYRYFEYYFGKYPHIFRKNRNGIASLTGNETSDDLSALADDIFLYFGKGCRSVSKLYLPEDFRFESLSLPFQKYQHIINHHKYLNNYNYHKAIFLLEKIPFIDLGNSLLTKNAGTASPVSVIHYEYYQDRIKLIDKLKDIKEKLQCVVSTGTDVSGSVRPGRSQFPSLSDWADGIDTMDFLVNL